MKKLILKRELNRSILFFDGAMGTLLDSSIPAGTLPELLNITNPSLITDIHKRYIAAGADIITANTFGANRLKLSAVGYGAEQIITAAVSCAKAANPRFTAVDIGPLGQMLKPTGTMSFDDAYALFAEQVQAAEKAGADLLIIETMSDLYELKAAILAAKENCGLPIVASLTFEKDCRTFMGVDALTAVTFLNGIGVDAIGVNCSGNPFDISPVVDTFVKYSRVAVLVMPNAGLPVATEDGTTSYSVTPDAFAVALAGYYEQGVTLFGGCCGTDPDYILAVVKTLKGKPPVKRTVEKITAVTSGTKTAALDHKITVIGERINPTGKPRLKDAIKSSNTDFIISEAVSQVNAGADILDVNCGLPDVDEAKTIKYLITELQSVIDLPLQIDSSDPKTVESAVRIYNGKPLINSVNGGDDSLKSVLPIVKKYGGAVIGLTLDENGIPKTAENRFKIAEKIVKTAILMGIPESDVVIDCLVLTASAQQTEVFETIKAIRLVKERLGVKTVLGVSNVSFGLPNRPFLNSIFLTSALAAGLDAAIINPLSGEMTDALKAFRVLNAEDTGAAEYIKHFGEVTEVKRINTESRDLITLISSGQKTAAAHAASIMLENTDAIKLIDDYLVPALDLTGKEYESGKIFLPQLIQAAESAKACFEEVKRNIKTGSGIEKGKIVLATVKGDIHDIGKNIVKVLLQSYGYEVIDLGKDVDPQTIVETAVQNSIRLVGLSALMTTTVPSMKTAIEMLRTVCPEAKIMVGGAVMSEEYAKYVGADFYAADARASVKIADKIFSDGTNSIIKTEH